jgi:alpha-galactosidase
VWRRFMLEYYSPQEGGKPVAVPLAAANWGAMSAADQMGRVKWYVDNDLPIDCFWIDAGWSGKTGPIDMWVANAATRIANPELYPNGMKEVSDSTRARSLKFLLWMWPNRAVKGLEIGAEHPEWVLPGEAVDHGVPEVNEWMKQYYSKIISDYGLDIFRQDGNPVYPADESPDRQGINQIRHFLGFYEFWDYLLAEHPGLMIDNCSGGGRKIDLETAKRSVSMWRSDFQVAQPFDPIGMQGQTYGLSFWVALSSGCTRLTDNYTCHSSYSPGIVLGFTDPPNYAELFDYQHGRKLMKDYVSVRHCFYGDYYPLTDYSIARDAWMAWQFDRPELQEGLVQAFRREHCFYEGARLKLKGLETQSRYTVENLDKDESQILSGLELMEKGLSIEISEIPGTAVITYKKIN